MVALVFLTTWPIDRDPKLPLAQSQSAALRRSGLAGTEQTRAHAGAGVVRG